MQLAAGELLTRESASTRHAASCEHLDVGAAVRVAVPPGPAGTPQEGLALSVDMQLLPGVHHLRRLAVRPEDQPQRHHLTVSSLQGSFSTQR